MKSTLKIVGVAFVIVCGLMMSSCNGNDDKKPEVKEITEVKNLDATKFEAWVYFSFAKGMVVEVSNPETDKGWDVAFHREQVRVNAKEGFSGNAAVALTNITDFDASISTSGLEFVGNVKAFIPMGMDHDGMTGGGDPYVYEEVYYVTNSPDDFKPGGMGGKRLNKYTTYKINMKEMGSPNMYQPKPELFVFKSADGKKHYKLQITRAINDQGKKGGTLSFKYQEL